MGLRRRQLSHWPCWRLLGLCGVAAGKQAKQTMHLVDVPDLLCGESVSTTLVHLDVAAEEKNVSAPHVLTFYRTSLASVAVTFSLRSASGESILQNTTVTLNDLNHKRLLHAEDEAMDQNCEDFFLIDGRDPVDLPDTWGEARVGFRGICENEGVAPQRCAEAEESAFMARPRGDAPLAADSGFCQRLAQHGQEYWGFTVGDAHFRRLKAAGSFGGHAGARSYSAGAATRTSAGYAGRWANPLYPGLGAFTFGAAFMAMSYPRGFHQTAYGYTGYAGKEHSDAAAAGKHAARTEPMAVFIEQHKSSHSRAITHCFDGSNQSCINGQVNHSNGPCVWEFDPGDRLARDDLMLFGFQTQARHSPYELTISAVSGSDYAKSRICSPSGWNRNTTLWKPPPREDLFVTLTRVKRLSQQEEDITGFLTGAGIMVCLSFLLALFCRHGGKQRRARDSRRSGHMQEWPRSGQKQKVPPQCVPPQD